MSLTAKGALTDRLRLPSIRVSSTEPSSRDYHSSYVLSNAAAHMIFTDHQTQQDVKEEAK